MNGFERCLGCMEPRDEGAECAFCGWMHEVPPAPSQDLIPGTALQNGRYVVGRVLGRGGFGITYIGWDVNLARRVAIKEYYPQGVAARNTGTSEVYPYGAHVERDYAWGIERYLDEARLLAQFENHPNIVWVKDYFAAHGTAYLVQEFLDGITFEHFLKRGRIDWAVTLRIMTPVLDALREVHKYGVLHRDVSPDNIFLLRTGMVKLIDFGAARIALGQRSQNLSIILKHGYAPWEQYQTRGAQGPWTDVHAAAATMYRALTGAIPVAAPDRMPVDTLERPSAIGVELPPGVEAVLMKGLALDRADRYEDVAAFQAALADPVGAAALADPEPAVDLEKTKPFRTGALPPQTVTPAPHPVPIPAPAPALTEPAPMRNTKADPPPAPMPRWLLAAVGIAAIAAVGAAVGYSLKDKFGAKEDVARNDPPSKEGPRKPGVLDPPESEREDPKRPGPSDPEPEQQKNPEPERIPLQPKQPTGVIPEPRIPRTEPKPPAEPPRVLVLTFDPPEVPANQPSRLTWEVTGAETVRLAGIRTIDVVQPAGSLSVRAPRTVSVRIQAVGAGGQTATGSATLRVIDPPPQAPVQTPVRISRFSATRVLEPVSRRYEILLQWAVEGATEVRIEPGLGRVPATGSQRVVNDNQVRYLLTAVNAQSGDRQTAQSVVPALSNFGNVQRPATTAWPVRHDHTGVISLGARTAGWKFCSGQVVVTSEELAYSAPGSQDSFRVPLREVTEAAVNRLPIQGYKAFHVKLSSGRNFNFVPTRGQAADVVEAIQRAMK